MAISTFMPRISWTPITGLADRVNGLAESTSYTSINSDPEDAVLLMEDWPGPVGVLKKTGNRYPDEKKLAMALAFAASLVVRYGKKLPEGSEQGDVTCTLRGAKHLIPAGPLADDTFRNWAML
jgi:hypothetical protein